MRNYIYIYSFVLSNKNNKDKTSTSEVGSKTSGIKTSEIKTPKTIEANHSTIPETFKKSPNANTPVALLAVVGFYLAYFSMMNPTSSINAFASMFPISSPFCMPFRVMMGIATPTDVAISLAILLVTILVIAKVAIKIYSSAIFNYGSKMSFKDIMRIYKDKNN